MGANAFVIPCYFLADLRRLLFFVFFGAFFVVFRAVFFAEVFVAILVLIVMTFFYSQSGVTLPGWASTSATVVPRKDSSTMAIALSSRR